MCGKGKSITYYALCHDHAMESEIPSTPYALYTLHIPTHIPMTDSKSKPVDEKQKKNEFECELKSLNGETQVNEDNKSDVVENAPQNLTTDNRLTFKQIRRKPGRPKKIVAMTDREVFEGRKVLLDNLAKLGVSERELKVATMLTAGANMKEVAAETGISYGYLRNAVSTPTNRIYQAIQAFKQTLAQGYANLADLIVSRARVEISSGSASSAYQFAKLALELIDRCKDDENKQQADVINNFFTQVNGNG